MTSSFHILDLEWVGVSELSAEENKQLVCRVEEVCSSWDGTPFRKGQICKGVGAYCAALPIAILDELFGITEEIPKLAYLKKKQILKSARFMLDRYKDLADVFTVKNITAIEPGDLFVVGIPHPVHVYLAGGHQSHLWHTCQSIGVCRTGLGFYDPLSKVYRVSNKRSWLKNPKSI